MSTKTDDAARRVELVPLPTLGKKGNPRNPKSHDLGTIDSSVGRFGYVEPIVLDERTGLIISGHGRTQTLADMEARGEAPPEGIATDDKGNWLVPVVRGWKSRTDSEANAALIALNRSTELGGWDDSALLELLEDLEDVEDGLTGVGFEDFDIEALRIHLDSVAEVDGFGTIEDAPTGGDDGGVAPSLPDLDGTTEVAVIFPEENYKEFYAVMAGLPWVIDVRDKFTRKGRDEDDED